MKRPDGLDLALSKVVELDAARKWDDLQSKDLPAELVTYVAERLSEVPLDTIRKELGIASASDVRWRKIMMAIKGGIRIDATGIFLKWLRRNDQLGTKVGELVDRVLDGQSVPNKTIIGALDTMANLQLTTIKMGKELGIFMDATQQQANQSQGNGQVTIIVQSNVQTPSREAIEIHQAKEKEKNQKVLEAHAVNREDPK